MAPCLAISSSSSPRRRCGFTLIELLVTIALMAVLIAILLPSLGSVRARARTTLCQTQLHKIAYASAQYQQRFSGAIPFLNNVNTTDGNGFNDFGIWPVLLAEELSLPVTFLHRTDNQSKSVIKCPDAVDLWDGSDLAWWGYPDYVPGVAFANLTLEQLKASPSDRVFLADTRPVYDIFNPLVQLFWSPGQPNGGIHLRHENAANHLYFDAHVEMVGEAKILDSLDPYRNVP